MDNSSTGNTTGFHQAIKLTEKAANVGFDWPTLDGVFAKIAEEIQELQQELQQSPVDRQHLLEELGDVLFALANLARKLALDPDRAIAATNRKFARRFAFIEQALQQQGKQLTESNLAEMDELWEQAKAGENHKDGL